MRETPIFHSPTKLINKKHTSLLSLLLIFSVITSACASTSQTSEIEKPYSATTAVTASTPSTTTTTTTTTSAPVFLIPSEDESFEKVAELCDLASNSLECEEDCLTDDSNLRDCIDEAEEIINTQKPEKDTEFEPLTTWKTTTSTTLENTQLTDEENVNTIETTTENVPVFIDSYTFSDNDFGTQVTVVVSDSVRSINSNALANHETGTFPNSGNPNSITEQDASYEFTTEPVYTGSSTEVLTTGVAINGVKFEPGTAESVSCASGEFYRIEALQETYNLGLDTNNAHVQPTGEYHYHGVSKLLVDAFNTSQDLVHLGFAADGFLIYYSKSNNYESGYALKNEPRTGTDCLATGPAGGNTVSINGTFPDGTYTSDWIHTTTDGKLDTCNGISINNEYIYLMTDTFPYIPRCLNGQVSESTSGRPPPPPALGRPPGGGPPPDLTFVAETLGIELSDLMSALGPPPPDLEGAALKLDVPLSELQSLMPLPG